MYSLCVWVPGGVSVEREEMGNGEVGGGGGGGGGGRQDGKALPPQVRTLGLVVVGVRERGEGGLPGELQEAPLRKDESRRQGNRERETG